MYLKLLYLVIFFCVVYTFTQHLVINHADKNVTTIKSGNTLKIFYFKLPIPAVDSQEKQIFQTKNLAHNNSVGTSNSLNSLCFLNTTDQYKKIIITKKLLLQT